MVYFPNWAESVATPSDFDIRKISPFDDESNFILLFAGNLGEAQNLDAIIESADRLKDNEKIKFVFVGDGRRKTHLENLVAEKKLNNTVYFLGRYPIDTMPVFMGKASVLLFSLKDELCFNLTVPAKVQFYMSQGKPILAMINGDGADLVNESKCGFAVPANDVKGFVDTVKLMAKLSNDELTIIGLNGKLFYEQNFTKEQRINQLTNLLKLEM